MHPRPQTSKEFVKQESSSILGGTHMGMKGHTQKQD